MLWEVHASAKPSYEVFQCEHADVLISEMPAKDMRKKQTQVGIQASTKTLEALSNASQASGSSDPWEAYDPWMQTKSLPKYPKLTPPTVTAEQIDAVAAKVEKRVLEVVQKQNTDEDMGASETHPSKVSEIEQRLTQMESKLQAHQTQQALHNQEIANRFNQMQTQVDQQGASMQSYFDSRLAEQLQQIEALLHKQRKTE